MFYILLTLLSGVAGGLLSIYFRALEMKKQVILMPKQLFSQIALSIIFALIFREFFSEIFIDFGFVKLGWLSIYIIFSSASYYAVQVFYEYFSGNTLFATESEMQKYLEKLEDER